MSVVSGSPTVSSRRFAVGLGWLLLATASPAFARPGTPNAVVSWSPAPGVMAVRWQNTASEDGVVFDIEGMQDASVANWSPDGGVGMGSILTYYFTRLPAGRHCFRVWSRVGVQGERSDQPSNVTCANVAAVPVVKPPSPVTLPRPPVGGTPGSGPGGMGGGMGAIRGVGSVMGIPHLTTVTVWFNNNGDGKDDDTAVDLGVSDAQRNQIAYKHIYGPEPDGLGLDNGDTKSIQLTVNSQVTKDQIRSGYFNIEIEPVGHDTWNYTAYLKFTFSDGSSMLGYLRDSVSETNRRHTTPLTQFFQH